MGDAIEKRRRTRKQAQPALAEAVAVEQPQVMTVDAAPALPPGLPMPIGQTFMLTREELHKLRLYEAESRAARAEAEAARMKRRWILAMLDPKGHVEAAEKQIEEHVEKSKEWARKHEVHMTSISMRLGFDLRGSAFDVETGVVVPDTAKGSQ